ncbi:hypothetical protein HMPREF3213_02225 [Heyndrickxia coagulans]|uniref:Uncharacterized protein n=1 Tax=Heyndrickxia coagulans TaxID=1398 RepID=A0A133KMG4_HEYCO|nr:hypothetical protein HMPREF3213_02225 [Heyndrickxia coagulans]
MRINWFNDGKQCGFVRTAFIFSKFESVNNFDTAFSGCPCYTTSVRKESP